MKTMFLIIILMPYWACAQILNLPPRSESALNGDQFVDLVSSMALNDRENEIFAQVMSGNIPDFQRNLVAVTYTETISTVSYTYTYYVLPDYLAIGCDTNYFLCPMTPLLAQRIANATGCTMPTRKMVDDIWAAATVHLAPSSIPPGPEMITIPVMAEHNETVWGQRSAVLATHPLGELVGGDKKDVVISNLIYGYPAPGRVVIYGWHYTSGTPIQPLYNGHEETYADYSHGIRLVQNEMIVNGSSLLITDILQSDDLYALLSDEGVIEIPWYPYAEPELSVPVSFAVIPASSESVEIIVSPQIDATHYLVTYGTDGIDFSQSALLPADSLVIGGLTTMQPVFLKIAAVCSVDTSEFSEVLGATPENTGSQVIVINGFDRPVAGNTFDFVRQHGLAINNSGYGFSSATNEALTNSLVSLNDYRIADYISGAESSINESFSNDEQEIVSDYLKNGGNLFVSGAEIGWDLDHLGSAGDKYFYNNYLKAAFYLDAPNDEPGVFYQAQETAGAVFESTVVFNFDDGTNGTYNVNYPDVIVPFGGSEVCLEYNGVTDNYAGICFSGVFPEGTTVGKLVNFGFPFETIYPVEIQNSVMGSIISFFDESTIINQMSSSEIFISPNPFTDYIKVQVNNGGMQFSDYTIIDCSGKMVQSGTIPDTMLIDTGNLKPGLYLLMIESDGILFTKKLLKS